MNEDVTVRDLRNHGGRILDRVMRGEIMTVTRSGRAVAELRPLPQSAVKAHVLLNRWRSLPDLDAGRLKADVDDVLDASL